MYLPAMDGGGTEAVFALLSRAFVARGYAVDLVLNAARGPTLERIDAGTNVVDLQACRSIAALPKLAAYLRRHAPAVLLSAFEVSNVIAVAAAVMARTRCAVSVHAIASHTLDRRTDWQYRYLRPVMSRAYARADVIITVSDAVADDLARLTGISRDTMQRIYNPLPPEIDDLALADRGDAYPRGIPTVLAVGRLVEEKDFGTLLHAFSLLRERRRAQLVVLGDGPEKTRLAALARALDIAADVHFLGFVSNPYAHMRSADVLAVSSISEGLGNVIVEALACGTPVVSTNCVGGPAEILCDGKYGRLVPVGDAGALADAIAATLDAPPPTNLRARADDFKLDQIAAQYLGALGL
jgi:glycosyltransferase involved in cell wall biosynthesis